MSGFLMKSATPNQTIEAKTGVSYVSDGSGFISNVSINDVASLLGQACILIQTSSTDGLSNTEIKLAEFKNITGAALGAAAAAGVLGYTVTLGTAYFLVGEATSSSAKTDTGMVEIVLPQNYVDGQPIALKVNANYTGSGTVTAASCSVTAAAYLLADAGTMGASLIATAAQLITATAQDLSFVITGTSLKPGARLLLELSLLVTSASGANTGQVNSVRLS